MTPDEVTHKERRGAPEPLIIPLPQPAPQPQEPVLVPAGYVYLGGWSYTLFEDGTETFREF